MYEIDLNIFTKKAEDQYQENMAFFKRLKQKKPKNLDSIVHQLHEEVFSEIDCLTCANCCKTTSPAFYMKDIERMSKKLKIKSTEFISTYLVLDEDESYMFKSEPCPFLMDDNYCAHYLSRPLACKEYPHTNRKRFQQVLMLSARNTLVCPAVLEITNRLKRIFL
ncbi:MAG: YkgJ family cysteine cluster protein [Bacteroidetes bacterium]|nr:YkgJ family cysteine cluster protein [Bacteroidota bacterium]MBT7041845.1 YkgJ family cysteine cluster protein [Bacteroidota bacterium]MBT7828041.1 YkgJ family cysteine cluster protein [Bacteroidota bacterium]